MTTHDHILSTRTSEQLLTTHLVEYHAPMRRIANRITRMSFQEKRALHARRHSLNNYSTNPHEQHGDN